jgi:hypothetical protein
MNNQNNLLFFDLGYIGNEAENLQKLFSNYSYYPNEYGYYLKFINFSYLESNHGVNVETNAFESQEHFNEVLLQKLLCNYLNI